MSDLWESDRDYRRLRIRGKTAENPHRKHSMTSHRRLPPTRFPSLSLSFSPSSCHVFFSVSKDSECVRWRETVEWEWGREWVMWDQTPIFFSSPDIYPSLCISVILLKATLSLFPSFLCNRLSPFRYYAYFSAAFPLPKPFYSLFLLQYPFLFLIQCFLPIFSLAVFKVQYSTSKLLLIFLLYINNVHNHSKVWGQ